MRRVIILGSTGSIGTQALDVIAAHRDSFQVVGLAAGSNRKLMAEQARAFGVDRTAVGVDEAVALVRDTAADVVLNGITGSVGLAPTLAALESGATLALANKESLIVGGALVKALAAPGQLVPVDSEHSAIAQALRAGEHGEVRRLVLTASGGPFRGRSRASLADVTPEQALAHPTWDMGLVVTTNSSTLVNKGLEVIEAHLLFDVPYERIGVVVHPQSLIHSLIHLNDGSSLAHLGYPDMRVPISYALHFPERADVDLPQLDLAAAGSLTFEEPDLETFACLRLALEAGAAGGTAPCVLNAADEVAVAAFLAGEIPFTGIAAVIERVLAEMPAAPVTHFDDLFDADAEARRRSEDHVRGLTPA
jgi:1-deoxy-D-xylulose-5-phosphate reductoisomerase